MLRIRWWREVVCNGRRRSRFVTGTLHLDHGGEVFLSIKRPCHFGRSDTYGGTLVREDILRLVKDGTAAGHPVIAHDCDW
jgi:hypothetical protein